jgi:hypothetical protein
MEGNQEEPELLTRGMLKPENNSECKMRGEAKSLPGRTKNN